jgi:ankyrin repeat protein
MGGRAQEDQLFTGKPHDDAVLAGIMGGVSRGGLGNDDAVLQGIMNSKVPQRQHSDDFALAGLLKGVATTDVEEADNAVLINLLRSQQSQPGDDLALANLMRTPSVRGAPAVDSRVLAELIQRRNLPPHKIASDDNALVNLISAPKGQTISDSALIDNQVRTSREVELLNRIGALRQEQSQQQKDAAFLDQMIAEASAGPVSPPVRGPAKEKSILLRIRRTRVIQMKIDDLPRGSLLYFASTGDLVSARFLCEEASRCDDRFLVNAADDRGRTALHHAAFQGSAEMAEILLQAGADVLQRDKDGRTPMHIASSRGHLEVARLMVGTSVYRLRLAALRRFKLLRGEAGLEPHTAVELEQRYAQTALTEYLRSLEDLRYNLFMTEDLWDCTSVHYVLRDAYHGCLSILKLMLESLYEFATDVQMDSVMHEKRFQAQPGCTLVESLGNRLLKEDLDKARNDHTRRSSAILDQLVNGGDPDGMMPLHHAAAEGNYRAVHVLVQHGADANLKAAYPAPGTSASTKVNEMDPHMGVGVTPFELAKDSTTRQALAANGARVDITVQKQAENLVHLVEGNCEYINSQHGVMGRTPLHIALFSAIDDGQTDVRDKEAPPPAVMALLQVHPECDPLVPDANGFTPLHYACEYGRDKELLQLVARAKTLLADDGRKAENKAWGSGDTVRLEKGWRDSLRNSASSSHLARPLAPTGRLENPKEATLADPAKAKQKRIIRSSGIGGGVQPHARPSSIGTIRNRQGGSAAGSGARMRDRQGGATVAGHTQLPLRGQMGRTPAHLAAQSAGDGAEQGILGTNTHLNCLVVLRQLGMLDMEATDDRGMTPLLAACEKGASSAVKWLLERKADIYKCDNTKRNVLHLAMSRGNRRTIRLLTYYDADASRLKAAQDWKGRRPSEMVPSGPGGISSADNLESDFATIWEAARDGHYDDLQLALRAGTSIDSLSPAGWTAAMYAAANGNAALLRHLLSLRCLCDPPVQPPGGRYGAPNAAAPLISRPQARQHQGRGPLHLAAEAGHADICALLVKLGGAQIEWRASNGFTPVMYACSSGHLKVMQMLFSMRARLEADVDLTAPSRSIFHVLATGKSDRHAACIRWIAANVDCFSTTEMLERSNEELGLMAPIRLATANTSVFRALAQALREARQRCNTATLPTAPEVVPDASDSSLPLPPPPVLPAATVQSSDDAVIASLAGGRPRDDAVIASILGGTSSALTSPTPSATVSSFPLPPPSTLNPGSTMATTLLPSALAATSPSTTFATPPPLPPPSGLPPLPSVGLPSAPATLLKAPPLPPPSSLPPPM